jgi:hypothetical protein
VLGIQFENVQHKEKISSTKRVCQLLFVMYLVDAFVAGSGNTLIFKFNSHAQIPIATD